MAADASEILRRLRRDAAVYHVPTIDAADIDPLSFYREYVCGRRPCVVVGMTEGWRAHAAWSPEYLAEAMGGAEVTVAVTPNGRADAVTEVTSDCVIGKGRDGDGARRMFLRPCEQRMTVAEFVARLRASRASGDAAIPYLQKQNDSFREEFGALSGDIDGAVEAFGTAVFGGAPEAVNFWMGGDRTVSSMHRDPYENLYSVVRGTKTFILIPPWEASTLPYQTFPEGVWRQAPDGTFRVEALDSSVDWIPIDPADMAASCRAFPALADARPLTVEVPAGGTLYLPSLWYHQVGQRGDAAAGVTVAVNYWYDINYNANYWMLEAVRRVTAVAKADPLSDDDEDA